MVFRGGSERISADSEGLTRAQRVSMIRLRLKNLLAGAGRYGKANRVRAIDACVAALDRMGVDRGGV